MQKNRLQRKTPVLYVTRSRVEWMGADSSYAVLELEEELTAPKLARAAARLVKEAGARPGPCILALGKGHVVERSVALPDMQPKEQRSVLGRKAANLLELSEAETIFSAIELAEHPGEESEWATKWLVQAVRRTEHLTFRNELQKVGFRVRRVVSAPLSVLQERFAAELAEDEAFIIAAVEPDSTAINLVSQDGLVHRAILNGAFAGDSAMASGLIQELRGLQAFWRKLSRGGSIKGAALIGLEASITQSIFPALHAALPGIDLAPIETEDGDSARSERIALLECARTPAIVRDSLRVPLAPNRRLLAAAGLLLASGSWAMAARLNETIVERTARERTMTEDLLSRTRDLRDLRRAWRRVDESLARLEDERRVTVALGEVGMPGQHRARRPGPRPDPLDRGRRR